MNTVTLYSTDDEMYYYDNIEDAIYALYECLTIGELAEGGTFILFSNDFKEVPISYFMGNILETISDRMYDELGENVDCYVDLTSLEDSEFYRMVGNWLDAHDKRKFYVTSGRSKEIHISKQDILDVVGEDISETDSQTIYGKLQY